MATVKRGAKRKPAPKSKPARKPASKPKRTPETKASNGHDAALTLSELKSGAKLRATYGGKSVTATIVDGAVVYRNRSYKSLSGAARAVIVDVSGPDTKSRANGRTFWRPA